MGFTEKYKIIKLAYKLAKRKNPQPVISEVLTIYKNLVKEL